MLFHVNPVYLTADHSKYQSPKAISPLINNPYLSSTILTYETHLYLPFYYLQSLSRRARQLAIGCNYYYASAAKSELFNGAN